MSVDDVLPTSNKLSVEKFRFSTLSNIVNSKLYKKGLNKIKVTDIESMFSPRELEELSLVDFRTIVDNLNRLASRFDDNYGDIFEALPISDFSQEIFSSELRNTKPSQLCLFIERLQSFADNGDFEGILQKISWNQLNSILKESGLTNVKVADLERLLRGLTPVAEYSDLFESLTPSDLQRLISSDLDNVLLTDIIRLSNIGAHQALYDDIFAHLSLSSLTSSINKRSLQELTIGQLRNIFESIKSLSERSFYSDVFEELTLLDMLSTVSKNKA